MIRYLHIDCEMGGRDLKYSLLTAYFLVTDDKFNTIAELDLKLKPDDGVYIVCAQGMSVNKIDLVEHDKVAIRYKMAGGVIFDFLKKNAGRGRLVPVGHGVKGDITHIITKLISEGSWEQFCTYHYIDTSVVLQFLRVCNLIDPGISDGGVEGLARHFNIKADGELHNCKTDANLTKEILKLFISLAKKE